MMQAQYLPDVIL